MNDNLSKTAKSSVLQKRRSWVSIILFFVMVAMAATGILSYLLPYGRYLSGLHTWFGLLFLIAIGWHIANNNNALLSYFRRDTAHRRALVSLVSLLLVLIGYWFGLVPFSSLIETGEKIRKIKGVEPGSYQTLYTHIKPNTTTNNRTYKQSIALQIDLRAGEHYESEPQPLFLWLSYKATPQMVFWLEDIQGRYIDTLFVTKKVSNSSFGSLSGEKLRRPEALPYWSHKRGVRYDDGLMTPDTNSEEFDGISGATPSGHYDIHTRLQDPQLNGPFRVLMEINRSYDFNDFYHKLRYPEDPVYSGSGSSGQPSLIYAAKIDLSGASNVTYQKQHVIMQPIGHGHHSGADGSLSTELEGFDTALRLVERVLVSANVVSP